jgi:peptide deformylase
MKQHYYTTHIRYPEDVPYLTTKLLDVNIRLLKCNSEYRELVSQAFRMIGEYALRKAEDYAHPFGFSGANAGIPWNIISYVVGRGTERARSVVMINPKIISAEGEVIARSNCASVVLPESIPIRRFERITVSWFDLLGEEHTTHHDRASYSRTIQHEVDHNLGILVTQRSVRNENA